MSDQIKKNNSKIIRKLFINIVITMAIAEFTNSICAVIDGIITGQFLGSVNLAASGLGAPYFSVACIISMMLMVGGTAGCTNAIGKGNKEDLKRVFSLTVFLGVVLSFLLAIVGIIFSGQFVILFGGAKASKELQSIASDYLRGLFIGAPGFIMLVILTPLVQLDGGAKLPKIGSLAMIVVDIGGDLLNVFVFKGGMFGMGLATGLSSWASLIIVLTHFLKKDRMLKFSFKAIRFKDTPKLVWDGLPLVSSMVGRALLPIILNNLIIPLVSDFGTSAYSALISASFILGALGWGIGGALMILGGMLFSEQDIRGLKSTIIQGIQLILIGVIPIAIIVFILSSQIASIFIPDGGQAYELLCDAFKYYSLALPLIAFNVLSANYFQATNRRIEANVVNFSIEVVVTALSALILSSIIGIKGIWLGFVCGHSVLFIIIIARFIIFRDKSRDGFYSFMCLKKDFGVDDEDIIECSLHSLDEVINLSENIQGFCNRHNFTPKETYRLSLCIEEMAGNVIEHGFSDGKPHNLDIRIIYKNNKVVLRMRDDCRRFDLSEKVKKWSFDKDHPEANIGIRLVMGSASKITYSNAMNTNNLIITLKRD